MARSAKNLGIFLPQLCEMAKIGQNIPIFRFFGQFFLGGGSGLDSCFFPPGRGADPARILTSVLGQAVP